MPTTSVVHDGVFCSTSAPQDVQQHNH